LDTGDKIIGIKIHEPHLNKLVSSLGKWMKNPVEDSSTDSSSSSSESEFSEVSDFEMETSTFKQK
jgi:hypothetical protein